MDGTPSPLPLPPPSSSRPSHPPLPIREDCWSEDATSTLVDAWGERHLELNRGNLRQKHWQEVADAVNSRHGAVKKARRTDVQCKNRIDTLKKKYKIEKAKILACNGSIPSSWPFYERLDRLIGPNIPAKKLQMLHTSSTLPALPYHRKNSNSSSTNQSQSLLSLPHASVLPVKRSAAAAAATVPTPVAVDDSFFRKNYSAIAAAAAASTDSDTSRSSTESRGGGRDREGEVDGVKELANAIMKFGEIYEKVEGVKQRQMVDLEKQRMEFMKSLEFQRMQLFMDWQVQLEKIKRAKRSSGSDAYS